MKRSGFSLIEVNMAIFVLAIGVLSMAVLYPLGLRESIQSQADLKQSMFADYIMNVAVSAASSTNLLWSEWSTWANEYTLPGQTEKSLSASVPQSFMRQIIDKAVDDYNGNQQLAGLKHEEGKTYSIYCVLAQGDMRPSSRVMGIMVRSLDMDTSKMSADEKVKRLEAQPAYYTEARFQGLPDK